MATTCCSCMSSFQKPALPCVRSRCDYKSPCSDLLNASVQAILNNANQRGSTADEIMNEILTMCEDVAGNIPESDLNLALNMGAKRGVLKRTMRNGIPAFMVNGAMTMVNPINYDYTRCLCELYRDR